MTISEFKISICPDHVLVERPDDYTVVWSNQPAFLKELSAICQDAGRRRVLILGSNVNMKLTTVDIFDLGEAIASTGLQIAVVETHDASASDVRFLENVSTTRGSPFRIFDDEKGARAWLGIA